MSYKSAEQCSLGSVMPAFPDCFRKETPLLSELGDTDPVQENNLCMFVRVCHSQYTVSVSLSYFKIVQNSSKPKCAAATGRWRGGVGVPGVKNSPVGAQYSPINTLL